MPEGETKILLDRGLLESNLDAVDLWLFCTMMPMINMISFRRN